MWGEKANPKDFADLRNRARNEMKHLCNGEDVVVDLQLEAAGLLERALDNYALCFKQQHSLRFKFGLKLNENWRKKSMVG